MKIISTLSGLLALSLSLCVFARENGKMPKQAMFKTKAEAEAAAPEFGCSGAHQMHSMWMVCHKHADTQHHPH